MKVKGFKGDGHDILQATILAFTLIRLRKNIENLSQDMNQVSPKYKLKHHGYTKRLGEI
jgi:hypothetical protein